MIKITKKRCMLIQCGFSLLSYFCATGLAELQVVNGKEKGTTLDYIKNADIIQITSKYKDNVFLDNNSGDYYQYNIELNKWLPQGNVGLHLKRCTIANPAADSEVACSRKPTFRAMESKHAYNIYLQKRSESKCCIKQGMQSHFLFQGLPMEFRVENESIWNIH